MIKASSDDHAHLARGLVTLHHVVTWVMRNFWDVRLAHKLWIGLAKTSAGIAAVTLGVDMLGYSGFWTSVVSTPVIFVADWLLTRRYMLGEGGRRRCGSMLEKP